MTTDLDELRHHFERLAQLACQALRGRESLACELVAEDTQFIRFNGARVRQAGHVRDATLSLRLTTSGDDGLRVGKASLSLSRADDDFARVTSLLEKLREDVALFPPDPYAVPPADHGSVEQVTRGALADPVRFYDEAMPLFAGVDLAGIYAAGSIVRATINSVGQRQWFATESFSLDYSLYTRAERAVKRTFAGTHWDPTKLAEDLAQARTLLVALERPAVRIPRGMHRAYLEPAAVADLIGMFSWNAVGERALQKGESPLRSMRTGQRMLSPLFTLDEDFSLGLSPRFTGEGHVSPVAVPIIAAGRLVGSLVHARTAREFGLPSNGASLHEGLRSASMATGSLPKTNVLRALDTGVFLSNLHYLNWSDPFEGRITGMTRYACLWVEHGEVKGPIETMRWDDSLYRLFGSELLDVENEAVLVPETLTYGNRQPGGMRVPGMLVGSMQFTL